MVSDNPYRDLPSVDALVGDVASDLPRPLVVLAARTALDRARAAIAEGLQIDVLQEVRSVLRSLQRSSGTRVINATGVLLHTNLGRANWSLPALERASAAAAGFSNVELDLDTGDRGRRGTYVETLLSQLTGAEAALVVNNNASALLLALAAMARTKAVPVARGELIEIGGSYRLPAVMETSGARLIEVGTTNRTRIGDYQVALQTHLCGALLKVHPSNYRIEGFTDEASLADLAALARSAGVPLLYDLGSGLLDVDVAWLPEWLRNEPAVRQSLEAGADLVLFSGDKLLGGPQAGLIVGGSEPVAQLRKDPLARALRVDAVTYAALGATLEAYFDGPPTSIPFWRHALISGSELTSRSESFATEVDGLVEQGESQVGAGSAPGMSIPSPVVRLPGRQHLFACLLEAETPILTRRDAGDLIVDLRASEPEDDPAIIAAILKCR